VGDCAETKAPRETVSGKCRRVKRRRAAPAVILYRRGYWTQKSHVKRHVLCSNVLHTEVILCHTCRGVLSPNIRLAAALISRLLILPRCTRQN